MPDSPTGADLLHVAHRGPNRRIEYIFDHGLAGVARPTDIDAHVRARAYQPVYPAQS